MDQQKARALFDAHELAGKRKAPANASSSPTARQMSGIFGRSATDRYADPVIRNLGNPLPPASRRDCGPVPPAPKGVSVDSNMDLARYRSENNSFPSHLYDMYKEFRTDGVMDYKKRGEGYRDFGNFNYGAYSTAAGIKPIDTLANSEAYSLWSRSAVDQGQDMDMIRKGIAYALCRSKP